MKIADVLKFMKAGYTVAEVKELENTDEVLELLNGGVKKEDVPGCLELASQAETEYEEIPPADGTEEKPAESEQEDYKAKYTELKNRLEMAAARADLSGGEQKKTAEDILKEIAVSYM
jgi:hypothetical protein